MRLIKRFYIEILHTYKTVLHILAMYCPYNPLKRTFYRIRGTKIARNVSIGMAVFIEEWHSNQVIIEDCVEIAPRVIILAHDSSYHCIDPEIPISIEKVKIKKNAYVGAGAIILPGVTVGEYSIVAAGAVVTNDVPPRTIVAGVPAKVIGNVDEKLKKIKER